MLGSSMLANTACAGFMPSAWFTSSTPSRTKTAPPRPPCARLSDEAFSAILEAHPGLRERFASIAMAVANSGENLKEADAIEERIVEEMRLLGREAMQGWAET